MNWLDAAVALVAPRAALDRTKARAALKHFARSYDGAAQGRNTDGWRTASTSADAEIASAGPRLRDRSRDLTRNNPYAARAVSAWVTNLIGEGIMPSPASTDDKLNTLVSQVFAEWAPVCAADGQYDFAGFQGLMVREMVEGGEALTRRRFRRASDGLPVPLQLQILEADFLDSSRTGPQSNGNTAIQGVEFDLRGQRVAYWLWSEHPGNSFVSYGTRLLSSAVPASEILHLYESQRVHARGVPWSAPGIRRLRDLDDYQFAEGIRKKMESSMVGVVVGEDEDEGINTDPSAPTNARVAYANFRSITLAYRTPGSAGNAFTVATSNATALRLDGATLAGGTTKTMPTVTLTKTASSSITNSVSTLCSVAGAFRFTGPNVVDQGSSYAGSYVSTPSSTQLTVERISDAPVIEFRTFGNNVSLMLFVDEMDGFGEYPVQDHTGFFTDATGSGYNLKVDWGGARRMRKYRLVGVNMPFRGVYEGPYDTGYAPNDDTAVLICLGDSYEQGVGSVPGLQPSAYVAKALGMRHYADGVGGTGWNSPGSDDPGTRVANRLAPQDATTRVGLVVFSLGYNDSAGNMTTGAQHMQEAINAYRASAKLNVAPLVMMTPHTPLGTTVGLTNVKNTIIAVAAANNLPVVDLENLFPSQSAGILDLNDGVHPAVMVGSPVRGRFMAERSAQKLLI